MCDTYRRLINCLFCGSKEFHHGFLYKNTLYRWVVNGFIRVWRLWRRLGWGAFFYVEQRFLIGCCFQCIQCCVVQYCIIQSLIIQCAIIQRIIIQSCLDQLCRQFGE